MVRTTRLAEFFGNDSNLPYVTVERDQLTGDIDVAIRDTSGAFSYDLTLTPAAAAEFAALLDLAVTRANQAEHDQSKGALLMAVTG